VVGAARDERELDWTFLFPSALFSRWASVLTNWSRLAIPAGGLPWVIDPDTL
jgi:hypothetical protein